MGYLVVLWLVRCDYDEHDDNVAWMDKCFVVEMDGQDDDTVTEFFSKMINLLYSLCGNAMGLLYMIF